MNITQEEIEQLGYKIFQTSLKAEDIRIGLTKALNLVKEYLKAEDIILYKKNHEDEYISIIHDQKENEISTAVTEILKQNQYYIEKRKVIKIGIKENELQKIVFIPIRYKNLQDVIAITNSKLPELKNKENFINMLIDTLGIILNNAEYSLKLEKDNTKDSLTGLDNRNSYNKRIEEIEKNEEHCIFVFFDLFRLKFINDKYSHLLGDNYISLSADILKKYFSKYKYIKDENGILQKIPTGTCAYRIGGDEFVVISKEKNFKIIEIKAKLAQKEVSSLDLGIEESLPIGINYGLVEKKERETIEELYLMADELLAQSKDEMYKVKKLERRI